MVLHSVPAFSIIALLAVQLVWLWYQLRFAPYAEKGENAMSIMTECVLLFCFGCLMAMHIAIAYEASDFQLAALAWAIITVVSLMSVVSVLWSVIKGIKKIKEFRSKRRNGNSGIEMRDNQGGSEVRME